MRLLTALLVLLVTSAHPFAQERTITIGVDDSMKFSVTSMTAAPGEKLKVVLKSKGTLPKMAMAHNFVLLALGTKPDAFIKAGAADRSTDFIAPAERSKVIAATAMVGPGETAEVSFTVPDKKGVYPFLCTFTGHYALGMKGTLTVR
jgi:azurin